MASKWAEEKAREIDNYLYGFDRRERIAAALEEARREERAACLTEMALSRNRNIKTGEKRILSRLQNPDESMIEAVGEALPVECHAQFRWRGHASKIIAAAAAVLAAESETPKED